MKQYNSDNLKKYKDLVAMIPLRNFLNALSGLVNSLNIASVLDIGCGEGMVDKYLVSRNKNLSILAADTNGQAIKAALELNSDPRISFKEGNIYNMGFQEKDFDIVLAAEVLEHLEDPAAAIQKVKPLARKYCIFTVPLEPYFRIANLLRGKHIKRLGNSPGHIQHWTKGNFNRLLLNHFDKVSIKIAFPWIIALCEVKSG